LLDKSASAATWMADQPRSTSTRVWPPHLPVGSRAGSITTRGVTDPHPGKTIVYKSSRPGVMPSRPGVAFKRPHPGTVFPTGRSDPSSNRWSDEEVTAVMSYAHAKKLETKIMTLNTKIANAKRIGVSTEDIESKMDGIEKLKKNELAAAVEKLSHSGWRRLDDEQRIKEENALSTIDAKMKAVTQMIGESKQ
tara:strand:- start:73 stop:651 length:579 start_codon:yes stop_codon:yes gene_type:complete